MTPGETSDDAVEALPAREYSLSVGVVTYRSGGEVLRRLLDSLLAAVRRADAEARLSVAVQVVCNDEEPAQVGAISGLVEEIAGIAPRCLQCELVAGHGNVGYGAAQNLAIRRSSADFHLVLNPDVELDADALLESVRFLDANLDAVLVAPRGLDGAGLYASLAKRAPSVLVLLLRALSVRASPGFFGRRVGRYVYSDRLPSDHPEPIDLASGCYMFCRASALKAVGGFDDRYFLYFEDFDLSRRIARNGRIYEVPAVRIRHHGGGTARRGFRRVARFVRSGIRYFNTYGWRIL